MEIQIELYETAHGKRPFEAWLKDMKELGLESIMGKLEANWFYFSAVMTKALRTGTLQKQKNI